MPERAATRLSELRRSFEDEAASAGEGRRLVLEDGIAWCWVEEGAPRAALDRLWASEEGQVGGEVDRLRLVRAELQAFLGNEEVALRILAGLGAAPERDAPQRAMVRARVAWARGDFALTASCATKAFRSEVPTLAKRARFCAARALSRLGRDAEARSVLRIETATLIEELEHDALLAVCGSQKNVEARLARVGAEAGRVGARRLQADIWAERSEACVRERRDAEARRCAVQAVEIWDDMATALQPPLRSGFWRDTGRAAVRERSKQPKAPSWNEAPPPQWATLLRSLRRLAGERDRAELLAAITDGAISLAGAERGFVLLVNPQGVLEPATIRDEEAQRDGSAAAFSRSIAEMVLIDGDPVVTVDASNDSRVQDYMSVHQLMLKSVACLPISTASRTWGVLYLENRSTTGRFAGTDLEMLRAYADQAAIAIETADLFARVEQQRADLERANAALRAANQQLGERLQGESQSLRRTHRELARLRSPSGAGERWGLVGESRQMRRLYEVVERIASSDIPIVVLGESGTGKELAARAIHESSARSEGPFVSISCGSIPEGLLEAELFGHVAGAFTGATKARDGVFVQAHGGTLFMDEVADMPSRMQLDLLRVLQEQRVRPVGGSRETAIDVRLVAASKRPLAELVSGGSFREDLFYRIAVVEVELPPLRERRDDIPLLCDHLLQKIARREGRRKRLSSEAVQRLCAYDFPGNVRELEHVLVNATVFSQGSTIEADDLPMDSSQRTPPQTLAEPANYRDFKDSERERILASLNTHGWNRAKAARALGMARRTFYRRLKEHGIELPS